MEDEVAVCPCVVTYIVNPHEFYIAAKEMEDDIIPSYATATPMSRVRKDCVGKALESVWRQEH